MGNSQPKYLGSERAFDIIGGETWIRLRKQLERNSKSVDYAIFYRIVRSRFDMMPEKLIGYLFRAFAMDINSKVEVNDFISSLAVIGSQDRVLIMRFLFNVYDVKLMGVLDRHSVEDVLKLAYGSAKLKADIETATRQLNAIFRPAEARGGTGTLSAKDFEQYTGPLDILSGWVITVLGIFTEPLSPRLYTLERRYSSLMESEEMMVRFSVPKSTCEQLRQVFYARCAATAKAELTHDSWREWLCGAGYASPILASIIFMAKITNLKKVWRFIDFAEFCMIYGAGSLDAKVAALCNTFNNFAKYLRAQQLENSGESSDADPMELLYETGGVGKPSSRAKSAVNGVKGAPSDTFNDSAAIVDKTIMDRMVYLLAQKHDPAQLLEFTNRSRASSLAKQPSLRQSIPCDKDFPDVAAAGGVVASSPVALSSSSSTDGQPISPSNSGHSSLSRESSSSSSNPSSPFLQHGNETNITMSAFLELDINSNIFQTQYFMPSAVRQSLDKVSSLPNPTLRDYANLLAENQVNLPGMHELTMAACCLFGIRPR